MAGYVVTARGAAVPGIEDLVLVAASGARLVDVAGGLVQRRESFGPRLTAAKDRTFKTVRPNQGTASGTVPIRRRPSL